MNATLITDDVIGLLAKRFGLPQRFDKSRILAFGSALSCSVNYSKLLAGHRYFFGLSKGVVDESNDFPDTELGDFVLLICGSSDNVLVLPRALVLTLMEGVSSRRIDVFVEDGVHILQTTRHPKLNVTEFLNEYPKLQRATPEPLESSAQKPPDRVHVRIQWSLIQLGLAEGCSVWVPPNDRNLAYEQRSFSSSTIKKLPNFGFDENTRRIVGNIDVLWLHKNVIAKAFEVESTTSIYSGLLRLNDLALSQPNNRIDLYVVASESRRQAVYSQLARPSFHPLISQCRYLGFATIDEQYSRILNMGVDTGTRVAGLIKGERFELPDNYVYPRS